MRLADTTTTETCLWGLARLEMLCDDGGDLMEQPNTQPYQAQLCFLKNSCDCPTSFLWLSGLQRTGISQYDYVYTITHAVGSGLTIICHIWGELCPTTKYLSLAVCLV